MPQRPSLRASLAFIAVSAPLAVWLLWRRRRLECSPALGARKDSGKAEPKNPEQARRRPPKERAKPADSSDDDDDEPTDERQAWLWQKMEGVLKEYSLSPLVMVAARKWLRQMAEPSRTDLARLRDWMVLRVNGKLRAPPLSSWQSGCPEILPGLRANPVWEASGLEWLRPFEENAAAIREELLALRSGRGFQPLKIPNWASKNKLASPDGSGSVSHDAGDWNVFYLFLHEVPFPENCSRCPLTTKLLKALGPRSYQHAFFSALTPGTHIIKHHGPTNKKLRIHLPLVGAAGSSMRVADTLLRGEEGKCLVFDDSFEHEAWHEGDATRIVLVFDVWHPDLTDREVQFFSMLQRSRMRAEMQHEKALRRQEEEAAAAAAAEGREPSVVLEKGDNFYQLLQDAKDLLPDNQWWVQ